MDLVEGDTGGNSCQSTSLSKRESGWEDESSEGATSEGEYSDSDGQEEDTVRDEHDDDHTATQEDHAEIWILIKTSTTYIAVWCSSTRDLPLSRHAHVPSPSS